MNNTDYEALVAAIIKDLEEHQKPSRFKHIMGVVDTAKSLAPLFGLDVSDAEIAALLHDNAKHLSTEELLSLCGSDQCLEFGLSSVYAPVLHAFGGATRAEERYKGLSQDILNAVRFHTTGRPNMTPLEMLIFVSDYIEPNRAPFEGLQKARELANQNLELCTYVILKQTFSYLQANNMPSHPLNQEAYHYFGTFCSEN